MNNQKKIVRIICLFLAFLMVAGVATIGISLIADALNGNDPDTHQTTHANDDHAGHNH